MPLTSFSYMHEGYALPRTMFPYEIADGDHTHEVRIAENKLYIDDDERLKVHLTLYCSHCDESHTVRTRFPYGYGNESQAAVFCKLMLLTKFMGHHQKI